MAATKAIAELAREPVPDDVLSAYNGEQLQFGPEYIIPKPFDARVLIWEASAVAAAAVEEGVAGVKKGDFDFEVYRRARGKIRTDPFNHERVINRAKKDKKRIVFCEGRSDSYQSRIPMHF